MISATVHEIVSRSEFRVGLNWGAAFAPSLRARRAALDRPCSGGPLPIAGLLVPSRSANGVEALARDAAPQRDARVCSCSRLPVSPPSCLALWWRPLAFTGVVLAIPGASLLTSNTGLPGSGWVGPLVVVTAVLGGTLVADFDRRHAERGWSVVMLAVECRRRLLHRARHRTGAGSARREPPARAVGLAVCARVARKRRCVPPRSARSRVDGVRRGRPTARDRRRGRVPRALRRRTARPVAGVQGGPIRRALPKRWWIAFPWSRPTSRSSLSPRRRRAAHRRRHRQP